LNNIIRLWHKAQKWHVIAAINDLLMKVNGARSKDGQYKGDAEMQRSDSCTDGVMK